MSLRGLAGWLLVSALTGPVAAAEFDRGDLRVELDGHLRALYTFTRDLHTDAVFPGVIQGVAQHSSTHGRDTARLLTRGRVNLEAAYGDWLAGQIVYDNEIRTGSGLDTLGFALGRRLGDGTWNDADQTISDHDRFFWRHRLYRGWLRYESKNFDLKIGRQRIALGRGRLWNPTDLFNPIPALAIEGDQRLGQDAAVARVRLSSNLWSELIWSPQDDPDEHRIAARLEISRTEVDGALMVARIQRDYTFGADFAATVRDAAVRGEATYTDLFAGGRVWQVVASLDYTFGLGTGLYFLVEHFFNENLVTGVTFGGVPPGTSPEAGLSLLLATPGFSEAINTTRLTSRVRNRTGVAVGYDLTPLLRADLLWLHDWHGPSEAFVPTLSYQLRSDLDLTVGGQFFLGSGSNSEYGDQPNLLIIQLDAYF
ncbi:MAG: hypothetical protein GY725_16155 [bacterium]|nr:hypothetical protein [bacterium]